jgi:DUF4097 and DUF4098 domain-containing protein YvlB
MLINCKDFVQIINSRNDKETNSIRPLEQIVRRIDERRERLTNGVMREYEQAVEEATRQEMYA